MNYESVIRFWVGCICITFFCILKLDFSLTCKDKHIIYVAQCQICHQSVTLKEDTYFGQTVTPFHIRTNGHRGKFVIDDNKLYQKSALSMHCFLVHKQNFSLDVFKLGIVKKVKPVDLDREESRYTIKYRTKTFGLNRIDVVK